MADCQNRKQRNVLKHDTKLNEVFCRAKSMVLQYALCNPWDYFCLVGRFIPHSAEIWQLILVPANLLVVSKFFSFVYSMGSVSL